MLTPYDANWPPAAERRLADLRRVLEPLDPQASFDHIGSTSVPGLTAKPLLDLQVRMSRLPDHAELDPLLREIGFHARAGSRPDSPVFTATPRVGLSRPRRGVGEAAVHSDGPDTVLHVRRSDSPWGRYTVMFRDWLRRHPDEAARFASTKQALALEHANDPDFDDDTRAKTAYFDEVQPRFERWTETVE